MKRHDLSKMWTNHLLQKYTVAGVMSLTLSLSFIWLWV